MGDITYHLKHDHRIIERVLRALEGMCVRIEAGESIPAQPVSELYEFLSIFSDGYHHGKEEKYLFPALLREGVAFRGGATDALVREHDRERKLMTDLQGSVRSYVEDNPGSRESFVKIASQYVDLMVEHFQKEDQVLFRIANDSLDENAKADLSQKFAQAEAELGPGARSKYEKLASGIEEKWAY
jgi:hemerythrin-like domain-containing protein